MSASITEEPEIEALPAIGRSRLGKLSRRKGRAFEREVAIAMREVYPGAKRGFQSRSGRDGCDVEGTPYWVECKHGKLVNVRSALRQGHKDTDGRPVVVVAKDNNGKPFVVLTFADWLEMVGGRVVETIELVDTVEVR